MRALHVIPSIGAFRGGPSLAVMQMARALRAEGIDARVAATNDNGENNWDAPLGDWIEHDGVPCRFFARSLPPLKGLREFAHSRDWRSWALENFREFDLVHFHGLFSWLPSSGMSAARKLRIPYVLRPLGILEQYSLCRKFLKKRIYWQLWEKANVRSACALHFTSARELEISVYPPGPATWVVPLGVDVRERTAGMRGEFLRARGWDEKTPMLLFLGRWAEKKRVPQLLETLHRLRDLPWNLVLAGAPAGRNPGVEQMALELLGRNRIYLPGFVSGAEKEELLQSADLFLLPSLSENFGIAVCEALAAGVPVVITPGVALSAEVLKHNAGWVGGPSMEAYEYALREALLDAGERVRRGMAAGVLARARFSWGSIAKELARLYEGALEREAGGSA